MFLILIRFVVLALTCLLLTIWGNCFPFESSEKKRFWNQNYATVKFITRTDNSFIIVKRKID